jgi:hypothetical protein
VDTYRIYHGDDPKYELWLIAVCEELEQIHREQNPKAPSGV